MGRQVTYHQQAVLRQAFIELRFAIETFSRAGYEPPPEIVSWEARLAATQVTVPVRCAVCKGSFLQTVTLGTGTADMGFCPDCLAAMEDLGTT